MRSGTAERRVEVDEEQNGELRTTPLIYVFPLEHVTLVHRVPPCPKKSISRGIVQPRLAIANAALAKNNTKKTGGLVRCPKSGHCPILVPRTGARHSICF